MTPLKVSNLTKTYPGFFLDHISFSLAPGKITGFIGRNGAGKSTTLKSLLNFVHPDSGEITFFGLDFAEQEQTIKSRIGYVAGAFDQYGKKKLKTISAVTAPFYPGWDEAVYRACMQRFHLDENKTPEALSAGMKVKYALTLALSHGAELLILDEPTSGLDPVSREDLLEVFLDLCEEGKTILFSTHITSDLEKCADHILYIQNGKLIADAKIGDFVNSYRLVQFETDLPDAKYAEKLCGVRRAKTGATGLIHTEDAGMIDLPAQPADLETIMVHLEKEGTV
ncbi:MAG: ABC transporter ATP-binding protein [Clostridia bacterium]|nr:ABC transporter ATP-binding protein [Clostridia bacterium]